MIALERLDFSYNDFVKLIERCPFSDEEIEVFTLRRKGKSVIQIAFETNLSDRTVSRRLKSIKDKIDKELKSG